MEPTYEQVAEFIEALADSDCNSVFVALATDWVDNRQGIPGTTYEAFYRWAEAACALQLTATAIH